MARGSFEETKCRMRKAIRRKVLSQKEQDEIAEAINLLGPKLNLFIKNQNIQSENELRITNNQLPIAINPISFSHSMWH